jgi:N6-adenosine-specific RNA methylase IME4
VTELVPQSRSLELLSNAKLAVAEARTIDEAKNLRDSAEALRVYAKQAGESLAIQNECAEVKLRAERKAGEILAATPKNEGGRPSENRSRAVTGSAPKLEELGVTKMQSHRWQQVASVDEADFEAHVESVKERGDELTTASVVELAKARDRTDRRDEKRARSEALAASPVPVVVDRYSVLCADPPWRYEANSTPDTRSIENHYPTMSADELAALEIPAADDAVLFMWATSPKLAEALKLMDAWAFGYRTCMVWVKDRIGMGYYARQRHELLLIGRRGDIAVPDPEDRPDSVIEAPRLEHSAKPEEAYAAIVRMYPDLPRIELFARGARDGWSVWGNEAQVAA